MTANGGAAYVIGGASGIGRAVAGLLVKKGYRVYVADFNLAGAQETAAVLNGTSESSPRAWAGQVDVTSWKSQRDAIQDAIDKLGKINIVLPIAGIGEAPWLQRTTRAEGFQKPDLSTQRVNETGVYYAVGLAVQYFRWMKEEDETFRGEILTVASIWGFYVQPTTPMYTASKHGVVGFVRSYGKLLQDEGIKFNAMCPDKVRTNIAPSNVHDVAEARGVLIPMHCLMESFEMMLPGGKYHNESFGECLEVAAKPGPEEFETRLVPITPFFTEVAKRSSQLSAEMEKGGS